MKTYYKPGALARNGDLASIHIRKAELGLDDDAYRDLLWAIARVRSAADLDMTGRKTVLEHLNKLTGQVNPWQFVDSAATDRRPTLKKLIMLVKGKPQRGYPYAQGIAQQMYGKGGAAEVSLKLLDATQLHSVVAALEIAKARAIMLACAKDNAAAQHVARGPA